MHMFGDSSLQYVYDEQVKKVAPSPKDTATQLRSYAALDRVIEASQQVFPPVPL